MNNKALTTDKDNGYDSPSWWYDVRGFFILKLAYRGSLWQQVHFFSKNVSDSHLEAAIGSGTLFGFTLSWLALTGKKVGNITGFDYSESMLAGARKRFGKKANIKLLEANIHSLPFANQSFSTVNVANAMHCFSDLPLALSEILRVLKPGGTLATNVLLNPTGWAWQQNIAKKINLWGAEKGILYKPYDPDEFRLIAKKSGFEIQSEMILGNGLFIVLRKPQ